MRAPETCTAFAIGILALTGCAGTETPASIEPEAPRTRVVRVGFRAAGSSAEDPASWRHLILEASIPGEFVGNALSHLLLALGKAPPPGPRPVPVRSYEIALPGGDPDLIVIEDPGAWLPLTAIASPGGKEAAVEAPGFAAFLRGAALEELRASMTPPRRPLEWSHAALAGFVDSVLPGVDARALRAEVLSALLADPGSTHLAEALIERAASFPPGELEPLLGEEAPAPKLLALTGQASRGEAKALEEILTLSLEHFGGGALFERSLRTLFPRASNPGLHARHGAAGPGRGSFVEAVRAGLRGASFDQREGWALER